MCGFVCNAGFENCDGETTTGCEIDLNTSVGNCGACDKPCANPNGTTSCIGGVCVPSCAPGWGDCDGNPLNGCETDTAASVNHCGTCNNLCSVATPLCSGGACVRLPSVTASLYHSCTTQPAGAAYCWGYNLYGRLGDGTTTTAGTAQPVTGISDAVLISSQGSDDLAFTCALHASGAVSCWGSRREGQLGDGVGIFGVQGTPSQVSGVTDAVFVSAGNAHACAVRQGGQVVCWGDREDGRLGDGGSAAGFEAAPVTVANLSDAIHVSAGYRHSCAVRQGGQVVCWGSREFGRLGDNMSTGSATGPVAVLNVTDAVQVTAGVDHTCARRITGQALCWGSRADSVLGDGGSATGSQATPVPVIGLTDALWIAAGYRHSCAVRATGVVVCWGDRTSGRIGNGGSTAGDSVTPTQVSSITDALRVSAGYSHSCAATRSGKVWCWGANEQGKLGDDSTTARPSPVMVLGLP
jgi:alpha-tubulin suppressor-like RCC1 family protein